MIPVQYLGLVCCICAVAANGCAFAARFTRRDPLAIALHLGAVIFGVACWVIGVAWVLWFSSVCRMP